MEKLTLSDLKAAYDWLVIKIAESHKTYSADSPYEKKLKEIDGEIELRLFKTRIK